MKIIKRKEENSKTKTFCLVGLLFFIIAIITVAAICIAINNKEGQINISSIISKWTEKEPEASTTNGIEENVREIDLTRIITGEDTRHTHIYEKRYDSNYHWEQCWMCNDVINKVAHNFAVRGTDSCRGAAGYQTKYCADGCGYSEQLPKKEHTPNGTWNTWLAGAEHFQYCTVCGDWVATQECRDSDGWLIGCNAGTCAICGYTYNGNHHGRIEDGACVRCGARLIEYSYSQEIVSENSTRIHYIITPKENSGVEINIDSASVGSMSNVTNEEWNFTLENNYKIGNEYHIIGLYTSCDAASSRWISCHASAAYTINGEGQEGEIIVHGNGLIPDNYAPTQNSITSSGNGSIGNFSTKATVTATFTDGGLPKNNVVYMRLLDKDKNTVISEWGAASQNGTTYTRAFDVTAEIREAANVYVQAKDATRKYNRNR